MPHPTGPSIKHQITCSEYKIKIVIVEKLYLINQLKCVKHWLIGVFFQLTYIMLKLVYLENIRFLLINSKRVYSYFVFLKKYTNIILSYHIWVSVCRVGILCDGWGVWIWDFVWIYFTPDSLLLQNLITTLLLKTSQGNFSDKESGVK